MRVACPTNFVILYWITPIVLGEGYNYVPLHYKILSLSLFCLIGPNLLIPLFSPSIY